MHLTRVSIGALLLAGGAIVAASGPGQAATPSAQQTAQARVVVAASTSTVAAASRPRVPAPKKISVHEFEEGKVTISWTRVSGVKKYQMHAYKIDPKLPGPYPFNLVPGSEYWITTTHLSYTFVNNFTPRKDAKRLQQLPWIITVASLSPNSSHRASSPHSPTILIKDRIVHKTVVIVQKPSPAQLKKEKNVVADCATKGLAAGLGTAGAGSIVAVASLWIPGVNAVTWTGVAVASAAAGISTTFVCMLVNKINPDGAIVHSGRTGYALAV